MLLLIIYTQYWVTLSLAFIDLQLHSFIRISNLLYDIILYCIVVSILGPNFFLLLYSHRGQFTGSPVPDGTLALVMQSCGQALPVTLGTLLLEWLICNCSALPHTVSLIDTCPTFLLKRWQAYFYTSFFFFFLVRPDHRGKKKKKKWCIEYPVDPNSQMSSETLDENIWSKWCSVSHIPRIT